MGGRALLALTLLLLSSTASAQADPLNSPGWRWMQARYFEGADVRFTEAVRVMAPDGAEDALSVPVGIDASALEGVEEVLVFADLNPITTILRYHPAAGTPPVIHFRFKIQQATPVRAAVRTADGRWHVAGKWIDAAGGGCTAPSLGTGGGLWKDRFGELSAQRVVQTSHQRLRTQLIHPMDTGLADGIPAFFVEETRYLGGQGQLLGRLETYEPVSENPIISVDLPLSPVVRVEMRDGQGNRFQARVGS